MKTFGGGSNRNHHQGRGGKSRPSSSAHGVKHGVKGGSIAKKGKNMSLKNRVRALERLIRLPPERLDPKVRAIKSSELLELKRELGDQERSETERKLAKKYHHVKFFERIKIERATSKLERKMKAEGEEGEEWEGDLQRLQELKEDLEYVMNFPAGERYVSLLKNATDESSQTHLDSERSRLRALIKRQMKESALVNDADEGKSIKLLGIIPPAPKTPASRGDKVRSDIKLEKKVAGDVSKSRVKAIEKEVEVEKDDEDDFFLGRNTLHSTILTGS